LNVLKRFLYFALFSQPLSSLHELLHLLNHCFIFLNECVSGVRVECEEVRKLGSEQSVS
jgi:hypothetical protein